MCGGCVDVRVCEGVWRVCGCEGVCVEDVCEEGVCVKGVCGGCVEGVRVCVEDVWM